MKRMTRLALHGLQGIDQAGAWIGLLGIRLLLAYEFGMAGLEKWRGDNWFAEIRDAFPFPFGMVPVELSWQLVIWTELVGAAALAIGLGTRFWAFALIVLDVVAWAAVHAGNGYNVCDNGYKLPLMYLAMLVPLLLAGPGKLSVDHLIRTRMD